jgi:uncharacterized protein (DUF1330 family)
MTVYVIAQLKFTDRASYDRYAGKFMGAMKGFKGRLLVSDEAPRVLEGNWEREKVVLISFPDEDAYREWADSPGYREIAKDRIAGADTLSLLVRGL